MSPKLHVLQPSLDVWCKTSRRVSQEQLRHPELPPSDGCIPAAPCPKPWHQWNHTSLHWHQPDPVDKKIRQSERPIPRHEKTSRSVQVSVNFFRKLMVKLLSRYIKQQLLQLLVTASARSSSKLSCSFSSTSSNSGPHLIRSTTWKVISCTHFLNWVSHHCRSWHSPSPDTLPDTFFTLEAIYAIYRKIWHTDSPESPLLLRRTSHFRSPPVPRRSSRNLQEALLNLKAMRSPHSDGPRQSVCCNKMTFQHRLNPSFNHLSGKTRPRCKLLFPSHSCFRWWRKSLWLPDSNPEKHWGLLCQKHPRTIQLFINLDAWTFTFNVSTPYTSIYYKAPQTKCCW